MAQPTTLEPNGVSTPGSDSNDHLAIPGKRKRDVGDEGPDEVKEEGEQKPAAPRRWAAGSQKDLVKSYFDVLMRYVTLASPSSAAISPRHSPKVFAPS